MRRMTFPTGSSSGATSSRILASHPEKVHERGGDPEPGEDGRQPGPGAEELVHSIAPSEAEDDCDGKHPRNGRCLERATQVATALIVHSTPRERRSSSWRPSPD